MARKKKTPARLAVEKYEKGRPIVSVRLKTDADIARMDRLRERFDETDTAIIRMAMTKLDDEGNQ